MKQSVAKGQNIQLLHEAQPQLGFDSYVMLQPAISCAKQQEHLAVILVLSCVCVCVCMCVCVFICTYACIFFQPLASTRFVYLQSVLCTVCVI